MESLFLDLQHQASSWNVVPSTCGLVNLSAHQHWSYTDLIVVLGPAANRLALLQRDTLAALPPTNREGVVHDEPGFAGVNVVGATDVAVGSKRSLGGGRHGVLPLGAVCHNHGLKSQRVDMKPSQRLHLGAVRAALCAGILVTLVQNAIDLSHLVKDGCHARIWVWQHCDVGAFKKTQQVGELLFIHPQRVRLGKQNQEQGLNPGPV